MVAQSLERRLASLEAARDQFGPKAGARVLRLLRALDRARFPHPSSLIRFHEALLFLRAFPQRAAVRRAVERILKNFHKRVAALQRSATDMSDFDTFEYSGIAGTTMEDTLSFAVARWLVRRMPGQVEIAWDHYEPGRELGTTGPRFIPLLEDDANVEADTPWRRWLEAAALDARKRGFVSGQRADRSVSGHRFSDAATSGRETAPSGAGVSAWLIERFERLRLPAQQKAELYESLRVPLRWSLGNSPISRTRNWKPVRSIFYHHSPLISRSQVSLADELARRPPSFTHLSLREGNAIIEMIREVMLVRYRELYGTTLADPRSVVRADLGHDKAGSGEASRGVSIYLWSLPPERRLPLRAYVAGLTLKNGVPINYIEAIGLCEWMEVGFNTFYTFRGGEAGWIYAQVLRSLCAHMGTTVVSVYPYQLGHDNDEAIESGAFWFYRKLGFRPGRAELLDLVRLEEAKIAADQRGAFGKGGKSSTTGVRGDLPKTSPYRTSARTLRRLAAGHVFYDLPGAEVGAWDRFSTRNIGLSVNRRMAREFGGDADRMRAHSRRMLERNLSLSTSKWKPLEKEAFDNFALVLAEMPTIGRWTREEKEGLVRTIRSKSKPDEMLYLHLTQQNARLRKALLRLGS